MTKFAKIILLFLLAVVAGGIYFWYEPISRFGERNTTPDYMSKDEKYPLINRSVIDKAGKHFIINFKPLRKGLEEISQKYNHKTYVYFSYLNNASWVGLNEREYFTAASTLKVPIAMTLLKAVEDKKLKLSDTYTLQELDLNDGFGELYKIGADKEFSVAELMEIMLIKSDNTALNGILEVFRSIGIERPLESVYGFLGWEFTQKIPELGETPDYSKINLKTLSNVFISLYDAKYLSIEHSSLILGPLSKTDFNERIIAGVPSGINVSHKIGTEAEENAYSDCGIVYAPNRHYILCLGSVGAEEESANQFMSEISRTVYNYVISN